MANRIRYIATDYETIRQELFAKLKEYSAWKDLYEDSIGTVLIELFSFVGDLMIYHLYQVMNENMWDTVQLKENMLKMSKLLAYESKLAIPSHGVVKVKVENAPSNVMEEIVIPKYTQLTTKDGKYFITTRDAEITTGQTEIEIDVVQGIWNVNNYISNGEEFQRYGINIDNDEYFLADYEKIYSETDWRTNFYSLLVLVNNDKWNKTVNLVLENPDSEVYVVEPFNDYGVYIQFGNNLMGKVPAAGYPIQIGYLLTLGLDGNVEEGEIESFVDVIYRKNGIAVDNIQVYNEEPFNNGANPEDIERIRALAPLWFKSGDRGVNRYDIESILMKEFPQIRDIRVWGEEEENPPNFRMFNVFKIALLMQDANGYPQLPTDQEKYEIWQYLEKKKILTNWPHFVNPQEVKVDIKIRFKKYAGTLSQDIRNMLSSYVSQFFLERGHLDTDIIHSDLVAMIENNMSDYIDYVFVELRKHTDDEYTNDSQYTFAQQNINIDKLEYPTLNQILFEELS